MGADLRSGTVRSPLKISGSTQPRVMILSVNLAFSPSFQGNETSQTDKFVAGLLLESLIVIRADPDRWTTLVAELRLASAKAMERWTVRRFFSLRFFGPMAHASELLQ